MDPAPPPTRRSNPCRNVSLRQPLRDLPATLPARRLIKSLSEPIARKANAEDKVTGRFWEGRFGCQALLSEKSILAAMAYVDLNPVRAKIASNIATSRYTSVKMRNQQLLKNPERAHQQLMPLVGVRSFNLPSISAADYTELVDFTGRKLHPGKRGKIAVGEPKALLIFRSLVSLVNFSRFTLRLRIRIPNFA